MPFKRGQLVEMVQNKGYEWIPKGTVGVYIQLDPDFSVRNDLCQVDWFMCSNKSDKGKSITSCFGHRLREVRDLRGEVLSVPV